MKYKYFLLLIGVCFLFSCTEKKTSSSLNESEIFFEETLASISKDAIDKNIFYIGTEDGIVYIYNAENQQLEKIKTDFDRIYKVVKDTITDKEPVYWVGTRNMGLFRCELKKDSFIVKEKHGRFFIPAAGKATKYSAYDISIQKSGIFVATSHGLLKVPTKSEENDTLIILFPECYKEKPDRLQPVVTCNFQTYKDQYLFCASDSGLLRINLSSDKLDYLIKRDIKDIVLRNDSMIYSLLGDSVMITDYNGKSESSFALKQPAQIYYYDEYNQINYFISNHSIQIAKDSDLLNSKSFKQVPTRRSIRPKCHNLITNDPRHRQSLLVTIHSISRLGHHQDVFNSNGIVKLACTDNINIYYLIGTKIYRQKKGENNASLFKDITGGTKDIRLMEILNDKLYYVDSDDEVYKASLYSNYFLNSILSWDSHIKQNPNRKKEVTAIGKDANNVYIGVRDGFRNLEKIDQDIPLYDKSTNKTIPVPFITKFITNGDSALFCTLNDGIFSGKDSSFTRKPGSNLYTFIRDIGVDPTKDRRLYLLTNHGYYIENGSSFNKKMDLSGYNRLLVLDSTHVFGVPNFGITNLCDSTRYFVDIQFNPMACLSLDNKIYAGSSNGIYVLSSSLSKIKEIEVANTFETIELNEIDFFSRRNIIFLITIIFALVIGLWWTDRYRMSRRAIQTYKDGLIMRLDELNTVRDHLNEDLRIQLDRLINEVNTIDVSGKKTSLSKLRDISLRIMELTSQVPSILTEILQDQVISIKNCEFNSAQEYVEKTKEAIKTQTLLRLGGQIRTNTQWLESTAPQIKKYEDYKMIFNEVVSIPQITDQIIEFLNSDELHDITLKRIDNYLDYLDTNEKSKTILGDYITTQIKKAEEILMHFEEDSYHYSIMKVIIDNYNKYMCFDNISISSSIKQFPFNDRRLIIMETLQMISESVSKFRLNFKCYNDLDTKINSNSAYALLHEDEKARVKKQDEDARKSYKDEYRNISNKVKETISIFYDELKKTQDQQLIDTLCLDQKKGKGQFMWENVLALLISGTEYEYDTFGEILGNDASRIRDAKSNVQDAISACHGSITRYSEANPSSIALLLLNIDNPHRSKGNNDVAK